MMIASSLSIVFVTEDNDVFSLCQKELKERFNIEMHISSEKDLQNQLLDLNPFLILWDSRPLSEQKRQFLARFRDRFSGKPIIAFVEGEDDELCDTLHRQGIHIQLDTQSPSFLKSLQVHVFAILLDFEKMSPGIIRTTGT